MAKIKGLQKTSLVDYPSKIVCTVFISSCNFRCGYCHNPDLVFDSKDISEIKEQEIFDFLEKRKKILDGVCVSGGEPTLYPRLIEFISEIKKRGFLVKLDTNGTNPKIIKELIEKKLLDYIAMDIKSSKKKYDKVTGVKTDINKIEESIDIIRNSGINYEFRTTLIPEFFTKEDALIIGEWLKGSKKYALQQFVITNDTVDKKFMKINPYNIEEFDEFKELLKPYFEEIELRI